MNSTMAPPPDHRGTEHGGEHGQPAVELARACCWPLLPACAPVRPSARRWRSGARPQGSSRCRRARAKPPPAAHLDRGAAQRPHAWRLGTTWRRWRGVEQGNTALAVSSARVRAARRRITARVRRPTSGRRSETVCRAARTGSRHSAKTAPPTSAANSRTTSRRSHARGPTGRSARGWPGRPRCRLVNTADDLRHNVVEQPDHHGDGDEQQQQRIGQRGQHLLPQGVARLGIVGQALQHRVDAAGRLARGDRERGRSPERLRMISQGGGQTCPPSRGRAGRR